jgi:hypothetical protein
MARQGRRDEAMVLLQRQEGICMKIGNLDGLQESYGNQAVILMARGRVGEAAALLQRQEAIRLELGKRVPSIEFKLKSTLD